MLRLTESKEIALHTHCDKDKLRISDRETMSFPTKLRNLTVAKISGHGLDEHVVRGHAKSGRPSLPLAFSMKAVTPREVDGMLRESR